MDDDNLYGEHYLSDLAYSFDYTTAGLVGKGAHYCEMRTHGVTLLRFPHLEHAESELIQGGTILADGDVLRKLRFSDLPRAVDSDLLRRAPGRGRRASTPPTGSTSCPSAASVRRTRGR